MEVNGTGTEISIEGAVVDNVRPTVVSTSPTNGATGVAKDMAVVVLFSETLTCSTVNVDSVTMSPDVMDSVDCVGSVVTISTAGQADSTSYGVTLKNTISDAANTPNYLLGDYVFSYTTSPSSEADPANNEPVDIERRGCECAAASSNSTCFVFVVIALMFWRRRR
jgi:hypothetical protein